jgi:hypothetical protein
VKRFCGFYLDCHMATGVVDVRRTATLGLPPNEVRAAGEFYAVSANSPFTTPIVFDLPTNVRDPKLLVTDTPGVDRAIEGLLIGDEDSFLHKRTYHALTAGSATVAVGRRP